MIDDDRPILTVVEPYTEDSIDKAPPRWVFVLLTIVTFAFVAGIYFASDVPVEVHDVFVQ